MRLLKNELQIYKRSRILTEKALGKNKAKPFDAKLYNLLNKKIGQNTVGELLQKENTNGCCYFYSLLLFTCSQKFTLVHGCLHALDMKVAGLYYVPFQHAWVETKDFVYDTSIQTVFEKKYFYKNFKAEKTQEFSTINENGILKLAVEAVQYRPNLISILKEMDEFKNASRETIKQSTGEVFNKKIVDTLIKEKEKSK